MIKSVRAFKIYIKMFFFTVAAIFVVESYVQHFTEARPLLVERTRNSESIPSSVMKLSTKMAAAIKRFGFCFLYHVGHFNVTHLITLLLSSGH